MKYKPKMPCCKAILFGCKAALRCRSLECFCFKLKTLGGKPILGCSEPKNFCFKEEIETFGFGISENRISTLYNGFAERNDGFVFEKNEIAIRINSIDFTENGAETSVIKVSGRRGFL